MTWDVKNNYAYVIMQDIFNQFIELTFYVGCTYGFMAKSSVSTLNMQILSNIDETKTQV